MSNEVNRRSFVGALGVGAAAAAASSTAAVHAAPATGAIVLTPQEQAQRAEALESAVAPLTSGSRLGRWTVERVLPVAAGAQSLVLRDASGGLFQLDVCSRAPGVSSPASTDRFQVFVANGGDGATATVEDHGLAAMALAEVIRANEQRLDGRGFEALAAREHLARIHTV
ncbi:MAG: hypothetical protein IT376_19755 [Polyangiaceae bacterium]|nr:hypothetical protein [Polyangiaceae bacterium]